MFGLDSICVRARFGHIHAWKATCDAAWPLHGLRLPGQAICAYQICQLLFVLADIPRQHLAISDVTSACAY